MICRDRAVGGGAVSEFDLVIIGGGTGGYVCAIRAAQLGLKVALVEKLRLGGVCLNWGCIPTKALLQSANAYLLARRLAEFGVQVKGTIEVDWEIMVARKNTVVGTLVEGVQNLLAGHGVQVLSGTARLSSPRRVEVNLSQGGQTTLETRHITIATGSVPARPPIPGLDLPGVVTSDGIMALPGVAPSEGMQPLLTIPRRLAVQLGVTAKEIAETMHAHPTLPETVAEAARAVAFGEAVHFMKLRKRR
jgi:pyruvate/2-oxoglutarate dehydrogenase complex dihydrolipoamide dehydrogenase (E3) component